MATIFPRILGVALAVVALAGLPAVAAPTLGVSRSTGPVVVDGDLQEDAWRRAVASTDFRVLGSDQAARRRTAIRCLYDAEALYLGIACDLPAGTATALEAGMARDRDGAVCGDECVEIYLAPTPRGYVHLAVNLAGVLYDAKAMDKTWNGDWTAAVSRTAEAWVVEVRVPWAALDSAGAPVPGQEWSFNIARNDRLHRQYATWSPLVRGFHEPEGFGRLRFLSESIGLESSGVRRMGTGLHWSMLADGLPTAGRARARLVLRGAHGDRVVDEALAPAADGAARLDLAAEELWSPGTSVWQSLEVWLDEEPILAPAPLILPAEALRARRGEPEPVTVGNDEVSLTFDRQSGRLLGAANRTCGLTIAAPPEGFAIAEIDAVSFLSRPHCFRDEDVQTILPDHDTLEAVEADAGAFGQRLRFRHRLSGSALVTLTITVPPQGVETLWDIAIDNPRTVRPSQSLVIHRVRYPSLSGLPDTACGADPHVVVPYLMGQRFPDPGRTLVGQRPLPYIGPLTMGWFDFYGAAGGLYVKVGDVSPLPETHLILRSEAASRLLTLAVQRWALCWPGERWTPGPCGLAPHAGDWHRAADLYRTWFRQTFTQRPRPAWLVEADGYVMTGGPGYEFGQLPRVLENAQAIGIDYIQLWSQMTGGELSYHAFGFPNPYMGTEADLKQAIRAIHRRGGRLGVYLNFNTGDPLLGTFLRQPRLAQKIPRAIPRPGLDYLAEGWLQQSLMDHTGSYSMWSTTVPGYLDDYWNTCPAGKAWTDYYAYWVVDKWAREYGLDVWYLDSCPVSRGSPCFATDHGHRRPAAEGQSIIDFFARLRRRAPRQFGLMQEYASDRLLQYGTHALGLMWHPPHAHPEVVRYTLPEYPLFSGMCNGNDGLKQFYPGERLTSRDAIERVFLIGNRFEFPMSHRPPELADDWQRRMVALRRACHPEMSRGDFLDDLGLGATPARVEARWFRHPEHTRVVITLLDRREPSDRTAWDLDLDLDSAVEGSPRRAWMQTLDASRDLAVGQAPDGRLRLHLEPFEGRVAALFLEVP